MIQIIIIYIISNYFNYYNIIYIKTPSVPFGSAFTIFDMFTSEQF